MHFSCDEHRQLLDLCGSKIEISITACCRKTQSQVVSVFVSRLEQGDAHSLVEMGRKETNPELKKRIVQKLSIMGNREGIDPE